MDGAVATPVSFTHDGSNNTVACSYTRTSAGKLMGAILPTAGGGGGYGDWATTNVGGAAANEDTNLDGVDNGIAYFIDDAGVITLPGIVSGTVTWINGGNIPAADYSTGPGTQFVIQTSSDLVTWTPVLVGDLTTNTDTTLTYTLPEGAGKLFARLVVTPN